LFEGSHLILRVNSLLVEHTQSLLLDGCGNVSHFFNSLTDAVFQMRFCLWEENIIQDFPLA
jgi:hypothetical protein